MVAPSIVRNFIASLFVSAAMLVGTAPVGIAAEPPSEDTWIDLRPDLFDDTVISDGSHLMQMETPRRAEDAAVVPLIFTAMPGVKFKKVTLVIDENPAPLAATFTFGPAAAQHSFATRLRVNSYSYIRAIAETDDGRLYMVKNFVKASGGCSAPATKDMAQAMAQLGKLKFRQFGQTDLAKSASPAMSTIISEGQVMMRHPNYSGLQMDQVTRLYVPPHFVDEINILHGDDLVLKVEGGISISEDPNIRFFYHSNGPGKMSIRAHDTDELEFKESWDLNTGS